MTRWYIQKYSTGIRTPVEIIDGVASEPTGPEYVAPNGKYRLRSVQQEGQAVPAQPGWYVLGANWGIDDGEQLKLDDGRAFAIVRRPIIAWEADGWGTAYVAGDHVPDSPSVRRVGDTYTADEIDLLICHAEYQPEPDPLLAYIECDVASAMSEDGAAPTREAS